MLASRHGLTWSDNKVRELIAVKVLHTSLLNTTVVAFRVLPLGSYAPMHVYLVFSARLLTQFWSCVLVWNLVSRLQGRTHIDYVWEKQLRRIFVPKGEKWHETSEEYLTLSRLWVILLLWRRRQNAVLKRRSVSNRPNGVTVQIAAISQPRYPYTAEPVWALCSTANSLWQPGIEPWSPGRPGLTLPNQSSWFSMFVDRELGRETDLLEF